ncbi:hypothetical protein [Lysobacter gummosus]|uniref:hypothetical protein n=1 Tax=Lysobacter gummosus TaxID=262324 RepID=UPI003628869A
MSGIARGRRAANRRRDSGALPRARRSSLVGLCDSVGPGSGDGIAKQRRVSRLATWTAIAGRQLRANGAMETRQGGDSCAGSCCAGGV